MSATSIPRALDQFLTKLHPDTHMAPLDAVLHHSLTAWLPYYRALQTLLSGNILCTPAEKAAGFFLFAQATLDGIADTVRCFFGLPWSRAEFSHARLTLVFPHLCMAYQLTGDTPEVLRHLRDLQARVVEHCGHDTGADRAGISPDILPDLMHRIDTYLWALLQCLAQNIAHYHGRRDALPESTPSDRSPGHTVLASESTPVT